MIDSKNLNLDKTHEMIVNHEYPMLGYGRLFITKVIPQEIKKILYLDTDIFAYKNIDELYDIDLYDKYAGVVLDITA